MRQTATIVGLSVLALVFGVNGTALAGIEPSPFHTVISNRTDRLQPGSPFYNQTFTNMVLTLNVVVQGAVGANGGEVTVTINIAPPGTTGASLTAGQVISVPVVASGRHPSKSSRTTPTFRRSQIRTWRHPSRRRI